MPDIRADGIAVYVYRKTEPVASARANKTGPATSAGTQHRPRSGHEFLQLFRSKKADGYQHSWQTVYGGVKKKETAVEAALRELDEETDLFPIRMFQVEFLETFYFRPKDYVLVMPVFGVEVARDARVALNKEHTDYRWVAEGEIEKCFMWRTQLEALGHVLTQLNRGSPARHFLEIDLVKYDAKRKGKHDR